MYKFNIHIVIEQLEAKMNPRIVRAATSALKFSGAMVQGQPGNLYADFYGVDVGADVRVIGGRWLGAAFSFTHPFLAVRSGVAVRSLSPELLDQNSHQILPLHDDTSALFFVGAGL